MEKEDIERIRTAELLILDDIGAEIKKEWVDIELFRLIDYRYSNQRVTIFTSNISMNNLKLNERIVDRIFSMCIKLDLPEKSIRTMQAHDENMEFLRNIMKNAPGRCWHTITRAMKPDNKSKDRIHLHCSRFWQKGEV